MAEALVQLDSVSKVFPGGLKAVEDLNLSITPGSFTALVGPSGAGKSTILRLMARLAAPSSGHLRVQTNDLRIGVVFQDPTLLPWANARENVALPLRLAGVGRDEAGTRAMRALGDVGLSEFSNAYPQTLSGGMRMRVALARALITEPHLLLLDEPFAALDEISRAQLNHNLLALWRTYQPAILFITHSIYEAVYLSETVHVLTARPGRIHATIEVDAPYPRDESFRLSPAFAASASEVSDALAVSLGARDGGH